MGPLVILRVWTVLYSLYRAWLQVYYPLNLSRYTAPCSHVERAGAPPKLHHVCSFGTYALGERVGRRREGGGGRGYTLDTGTQVLHALTVGH